MEFCNLKLICEENLAKYSKEQKRLSDINTNPSIVNFFMNVGLWATLPHACPRIELNWACSGFGRAHPRPAVTNAAPICGVLDLSHFGSYFLLIQPQSVDSGSSTSERMNSGEINLEWPRRHGTRGNNLDSGMMQYSNVDSRTMQLRSVNMEQYELGICFEEAIQNDTSRAYFKRGIELT